MDGASLMTSHANTLALLADAPDLPGAACADHDPELFFPPVGGGNTWYELEAKAVCRTCPIATATACLAWAMTQDENPYGIWGGTTHNERKAKRDGRPPLVCHDCGISWPDPGKQGRRPKWCPDCRERHH